jgi:15-cis-phytoene synthase
MSLKVPYAWEVRLLTWAEEALRTQSSSGGIHADAQVLDAAYHQCETITSLHSRTFFLASGLLPEPKRRAARALYAFCRVTDDLVDQNTSSQQRLKALQEWQRRVMQSHPPSNDLVALAWADTCARFSIPRGYAEQLINGVARDLTQVRYQTFAELAEYAYGVASTVGLMAMHITGFAGEQALPYAVKLGVALQITNILRDVAEDWRAGRLYLPLEELALFGLTEDDLAQGVVDNRWRRFMKHQIDRNRYLYEESWPGIAMLDPDGRFAIGAAAELYRAILQDIEDHDYDVFSRRAHVSLVGKVRRLPSIWWRSRRAVTLA